MTVDLRWYLVYCLVVNILTIVAVICFRRWWRSEKSKDFRTKWTNRINKIRNKIDLFLDRYPIIFSIISVSVVVLSVCWKITKVLIKVIFCLALLVILLDSAVTANSYDSEYYD